MAVALYSGLFVGGLLVALLASGRAVDYTPVGLGAVVAPAEVTPRLALTASIYSIVAVAAVAGLLAARRRHDRLSGAVFVGLYGLAYVVLILAR